MENADIARIFYEVSDILSLLGEDRFRIGAYSRAAVVIENLPERVSEIYANEGLEGIKKIPRIGESIALKIEEILKTEKLGYLERLERRAPTGLQTMLQIPTLGPKTIEIIYRKFKVNDLAGLEKLVKEKKLRGIKGFGPKTEENILKGIERIRSFGGRILLGKAYFQAETIIEELKKNKYLININMAGSLRRMRETIGDLDILATSERPKEIIEQFVKLPNLKVVLAKGLTKSEILLKNGMEADLRVVKPESYGAALHYFTGSKNHNIHIRTIGVSKKLKINEYGVFKVNGKEKKIGGKKEEDVFKAIGLPWIPPELREDSGEIEAGYANKLPDLIEIKDLKGDLHVHTKWSEGSDTIENMVKEAQRIGLKYIAITDHSKTIGITRGLDEERLLKQLNEIEKINKSLEDFKLLTGIEVDILANGKPDMDEKVLDKLDLVVASVHSRFNMSEEEMTKRLMKAIENPLVDIIAHPTTRKIGTRDPIKAAWEKVFKKAAETKTILEINCGWDRLDLNDVMARRARDLGVKIAVSTDSHNPFEFKLLKFGVATARRAWLGKVDVVNSWEIDKLLKFIKKMNSQ